MWLTNIASVLVKRHGPDAEPSSHDVLASEKASESIRELALSRLEEAVANGELKSHKRLVSLLYRWINLKGKDGENLVKDWVANQLIDDDFVVALATGLISPSWSQSVNDRISTKRQVVRNDAIAGLVDPSVFLKRVEEVLTKLADDSDSARALRRFQDAFKEGAKGNW